MYILIPSGIYLCLKCEVGISCFHQSSRHLTNSSPLCRFVFPSLLWTKFPCVHESVVETIPSVYLSLPVQIPNPFITFRKCSFTDTWNDAILWVRCEHLQGGQCSKSMTMWCTYLAWIPSNLPIHWEKCWQRKSEKDPGHSRLPERRKKTDLDREVLGQETKRRYLQLLRFFLGLALNVNTFVQKYGTSIYKCAPIALLAKSSHKIIARIIAHIYRHMG